VRVARAYAVRTDDGGNVGATSAYVRASLSEVAAALTALTGEPHSLACGVPILLNGGPATY
jgi:integrase/recombinase XerC